MVWCPPVASTGAPAWTLRQWVLAPGARAQCRKRARRDASTCPPPPQVPPKPEDVCCIMYTRWGGGLLSTVGGCCACIAGQGPDPGPGWVQELPIGRPAAAGLGLHVHPATLHRRRVAVADTFPLPWPRSALVRSGTTGTPKGVMTTHRNYIAGLAGGKVWQHTQANIPIRCCSLLSFLLLPYSAKAHAHDVYGHIVHMVGGCPVP